MLNLITIFQYFSPQSSDDHDRSKGESIDDLKNRLDVLMNSLATLSAEKSRMEANFQSDKRQMRLERDEVLILFTFLFNFLMYVRTQ